MSFPIIDTPRWETIEVFKQNSIHKKRIRNDIKICWNFFVVVCWNSKTQSKNYHKFLFNRWGKTKYGRSLKFPYLMAKVEEGKEEHKKVQFNKFFFLHYGLLLFKKKLSFYLINLQVENSIEKFELECSSY